MDEYKNGGLDADGLPPPYSSPEHQANAAAGGGIPFYIHLEMAVIIIITPTRVGGIVFSCVRLCVSLSVCLHDNS